MDDEEGEDILIKDDVVEGRREGGIGQERAREKVFVIEVREARTRRRVRRGVMGGSLFSARVFACSTVFAPTPSFCGRGFVVSTSSRLVPPSSSFPAPSLC